ncbi:unnamed protein product [Cylicostephanus goldi]|uniref:Uncharacterized protein n=1 Tax=Cylicostephanus goldi TaxID=71465 RepID=A0A3P7N1S9_CYLGO|nr:unnamed protein product [Cylicostephanus goldi]
MCVSSWQYKKLSKAQQPMERDIYNFSLRSVMNTDDKEQEMLSVPTRDRNFKRERTAGVLYNWDHRINEGDGKRGNYE